MWSRGDVVALRDIWFGAVSRAVAGIVIEDAEERSLFWIPAGAQSSNPADRDGREIRIPRPTFARAMRYAAAPCVVLCDSRERWTLWHFFRDDVVFDRWYVNFEEYLGRNAVAYDSIDHKLDLIVRPGGSVEWKDEDELEQAAALGLVDADEVRAEAARVLANRPWPTGWETFRPDASWPVPELPEGWDDAPARSPV